MTAVLTQSKKRRQTLSPEQILAGIDEQELAVHLALQNDPVLFANHVCNFKPHKKQIQVLNSPLEQHKTMLAWGRRFGKTYIIAMYIAHKLFSRKEYTAYIFAPSGDQSRILFDYT